MTRTATKAPTKFLIAITYPGGDAIKDVPDTIYRLSTSQNTSVTQPIVPATIDPSLAPL